MTSHNPVCAIICTTSCPESWLPSTNATSCSRTATSQPIYFSCHNPDAAVLTVSNTFSQYGILNPTSFSSMVGCKMNFTILRRIVLLYKKLTFSVCYDFSFFIIWFLEKFLLQIIIRTAPESIETVNLAGPNSDILYRPHTSSRKHWSRGVLIESFYLIAVTWQFHISHPKPNYHTLCRALILETTFSTASFSSLRLSSK